MKNTVKTASGLLFCLFSSTTFAHGGDDHIHLTESAYIPIGFVLVVVIVTGIGALLRKESKKDD